jgi:hypothetical protein
MANRTVCTPLSYDVDDYLPFGEDLDDSLRSSTLSSIKTASRTDVYPELVREFWGGLKYVEGEGFSGKVVDEALLVDMHTLSQMLEERSVGVRFEQTWKMDLDELEIRKMLFGPHVVPEAYRSQVNFLTPQARLIHTLIVNVFCPRTHHLSYVMNKDAFIIYHVLKNEKIDTVHLIYEHMNEVFSNSTYALPYGFIVTKLLRKMEINPFPFHQFEAVD